jgi:FAD:protein FMN transferase
MKPRLVIVVLILPGASAGWLACSDRHSPTASEPATQPWPQPRAAPAGELLNYHRRLAQETKVMGTAAELTVVARPDQAVLASQTLDELESVLRGIEDKMSSKRPETELSRLNAAAVGAESPLSAETLEVLKRAREFTPITQGAFDVTCRPILEMWRQAGQAKALPADEQVQAAVQNTGWRWFELTASGAIRRRAGASIDLGGIAKKHGIDRAAEALIRRGLSGLIDVGGDIRCVGRRVGGGPWRIGVRDPFSDNPKDLMAVVAVEGGSVCTSGNYERFATINGHRYSHIVDPRTGKPCDNAPSVTVVGPDATSAGLWATALSVLGVEGLKLMPRDAGLEVMLVIGASPESSHWYRTAGFDRLLVERPSQPPSPLPDQPGKPVP